MNSQRFQVVFEGVKGADTAVRAILLADLNFSHSEVETILREQGTVIVDTEDYEFASITLEELERAGGKVQLLKVIISNENEIEIDSSNTVLISEVTDQSADTSFDIEFSIDDLVKSSPSVAYEINEDDLDLDISEPEVGALIASLDTGMVMSEEARLDNTDVNEAEDIKGYEQEIEEQINGISLANEENVEELWALEEDDAIISSINKATDTNDSDKRRQDKANILSEISLVEKPEDLNSPESHESRSPPSLSDTADNFNLTLEVHHNNQEAVNNQDKVKNRNELEEELYKELDSADLLIVNDQTLADFPANGFNLHTDTAHEIFEDSHNAIITPEFKQHLQSGQFRIPPPHFDDLPPEIDRAPSKRRSSHLNWMTILVASIGSTMLIILAFLIFSDSSSIPIKDPKIDSESIERNNSATPSKILLQKIAVFKSSFSDKLFTKGEIECALISDIAKCKVEIETNKPPELTSLEIVKGVHRRPWLRKITIQPTDFKKLGSNSYKGIARARVYVDLPERFRFIAPVKIQLSTGGKATIKINVNNDQKKINNTAIGPDQVSITAGTKHNKYRDTSFHLTKTASLQRDEAVTIANPQQMSKIAELESDTLYQDREDSELGTN